MRVTDQLSRANIRNPAMGFLSDGWEGDLDTFEGRAKLINNHVNFQEGEPSIFVSATSSVSNFAKNRIPYFVTRDKRVREDIGSARSTVMIHIINGSARLDSGWPVLRMSEQIIRYKTFLLPNSVFAPEYILPFRVSPEQIVGSWKWSEIVNYMEEHECTYVQWHNDVVLPAFEEHEKTREKVL
jgi:hypothetical protein